MDIVNLYEYDNYLTEQKYMYGNIYEYDIRQANINMLYSYGKISYETYRMLSESEKEYRERTVGKMEAYYTDFYSTIHNGIIESKRKFIEQNSINNENIIRISNDAMFISAPYPVKYTEFNLNSSINHNIKFICKNHYNFYVKIFDVVLFMNFSDGDNVKVDIKGLGKKTYLHESIVSFLVEIFFINSRASKDIVIRKYMEFYNAYINLELDISYYREFNEKSLFRLNTKNDSRIFKLHPIISDGLDKKNIDIRYNFNVLREVYSMII